MEPASSSNTKRPEVLSNPKITNRNPKETVIVRNGIPLKLVKCDPSKVKVLKQSFPLIVNSSPRLAKDHERYLKHLDKILLDVLTVLQEYLFPLSSPLVKSLAEEIIQEERKKALKNMKIIPLIDIYLLDFFNKHPQIEVPRKTKRFHKEEWFENHTRMLMERNYWEILTDPNRVFMREISSFDRTTGKNSAAMFITALYIFGASGVITNPCIVAPTEASKEAIFDFLPKNWSKAESMTGVVTKKAFHEYIVHVFHPFLFKHDVQFPVLLFIEEGMHFLSYKTILKCRDLNIILMGMYHRIEPPLLRHPRTNPIKSAFQKSVKHFGVSGKSNYETMDKFGVLMREAISVHLDEADIVAQFKYLGLYPWNFGTDTKIKIKKQDDFTSDDQAMPSHSQEIQECLQLLGEGKIEKYNQDLSEILFENEEDEILFNIYHKLLKEPHAEETDPSVDSDSDATVQEEEEEKEEVIEDEEVKEEKENYCDDDEENPANAPEGTIFIDIRDLDIHNSDSEVVEEFELENELIQDDAVTNSTEPTLEEIEEKEERRLKRFKIEKRIDILKCRTVVTDRKKWMPLETLEDLYLLDQSMKDNKAKQKFIAELDAVFPELTDLKRIDRLFSRSLIRSINLSGGSSTGCVGIKWYVNFFRTLAEKFGGEEVVSTMLGSNISRMKKNLNNKAYRENLKAKSVMKKIEML